MHRPTLAVFLVVTACRTTEGEQSANNDRLPTNSGNTSQADTDCLPLDGRPLSGQSDREAALT